MSASPATIRLAPPMLGEHTDAILAEIGYDEERVKALRDAQVI
jgi:crotonobetainyl-CoA:carnitine CoA-transferase CaiB-like acyl-CoA transferase